MARRVSLSGDFWGQGEALPSYDTAITPQEFEAKAAAVAEQTRLEVSHGKKVFHDSGPAKGAGGHYDEFEDWDDAKFEAAAAAYQQRRMQQQQQQSAGSSSQPAASSSHHRAQSPRHDAGRPVANRSRAASPLPSRSPPPLNNHSYHHGQSSHVAQADYSMQKGPPQQPTTVRQQAPISSSYNQATSSSQRVTQPPPPPEVPSSQPWMSGASSDGHGRASVEGPPPFAVMDPSMQFSGSPTSEVDSASVARSRATSPPRAVDPSSPPRNPANNPGQLPHIPQPDYTPQRNLPSQPPGPRSRRSISYGPRTVSSQQTIRSPPPPAPPAPSSNTNSSQPWMSGGSSDGHGRNSMDVPPPFASMDPAADFSASPEEETPRDGPAASPPQTRPNVGDARYNVPAPPPLSVPQVPASTPLRPTSSPSPQPTSALSYRHSDVPSPSVNTLNPILPTRQRVSDVPSATSRPIASTPSQNLPPSTLANSYHAAFIGQFDKKMSLGPKPETMSRSAALYASAMAKTNGNGPSVSIDLNNAAYNGHNHNQPASATKEVHNPAAFYSSSVSSVMSKKQPLPKRATMAPPPRRTTSESEYSPYNTSPQNNTYGQAYGTGAQASNPYQARPLPNQGGQAFYTQANIQNNASTMQGYSHQVTPAQNQQLPQQQLHLQQQQQQLHQQQHYPHQPYHHQTMPAQIRPSVTVQNHWRPAPAPHPSHSLNVNIGPQASHQLLNHVVSNIVSQTLDGNNNNPYNATVYTDTAYAGTDYTGVSYAATGYADPSAGTGYADTGYADTGYADTGFADTGAVDTSFMDALSEGFASMDAANF